MCAPPAGPSDQAAAAELVREDSADLDILAEEVGEEVASLGKGAGTAAKIDEADVAKLRHLVDVARAKLAEVKPLRRSQLDCIRRPVAAAAPVNCCPVCGMSQTSTVLQALMVRASRMLGAEVLPPTRVPLIRQCLMVFKLVPQSSNNGGTMQVEKHRAWAAAQLGKIENELGIGKARTAASKESRPRAKPAAKKDPAEKAVKAPKQPAKPRGPRTLQAAAPKPSEGSLSVGLAAPEDCMPCSVLLLNLSCMVAFSLDVCSWGFERWTGISATTGGHWQCANGLLWRCAHVHRQRQDQIWHGMHRQGQAQGEDEHGSGREWRQRLSVSA